VLKEILQSTSLQRFCQEVQNNSSLLLEHLWDCPKALLAVLAKQATKKNVLFITGKKSDKLLESFMTFQEEVLDFLPWETLPGEEIAPSLDVSGKRLEILYSLLESKTTHIVHCTIQSLMQKTLAIETLKNLSLLLEKGEERSFEEFISKLIQLGYKRKPMACDKGEFAVRGGLVDVFPISAIEPYRIDFFGDVIEDIRSYEPISQRSIACVEKLFLCSAKEWDLLKEEKKPATLLDYLGKNTLLIFDDLFSIEEEYVALKSLAGMQGRLLFSMESLLKLVPKFSHLFFLEQKAEELSEVVITKKKGRSFYSGKDPMQPISFYFFNEPLSSVRFHHPFIEIGDFFSRFENKAASTEEEILLGIQNYKKTALHLHFLVNTSKEEASIREKAQELKVEFPEDTVFHRGYLSSGFVLQDSLFVCLPTPELTHRYKIRRQKWRNTYHIPESSFHQITPGDIVVHLHNGIGKFLGMQKKCNHTGEETEYFHIEYAEGSSLYVPLSQSHLITRYVGSKEEKPSFSVLGSKRWQKTYLDAKTSIEGYARSLLQSVAERAISAGFCFPEDSLYMQQFEESFPFVETEDQLKAIADCKQDMSSNKAMDRLICGDVGYGKTEVAMRAAFKAVVDGKKQVAVLVPTTVLAQQHYETFKARMANFPVEIAMLSRFSSAKQTKEILQKLKLGHIDIVIGTHRLTSSDVAFHDLGLLIIDEEQRFGVRAKELIKSRKIGVDCLTMSATPIPRTLYMSLIGARSISVISTPPQDRLPIKSIIAERDPAIIKNALLREFIRNGQAFFIHNVVETLPRIVSELQALLPEANIVMGHGQMDAEEIDAVFDSFKTGKADVLVCTTIVENGIDIPNANTILIDKPEQFGMADLYQLRGRVGRWNKTAYAYFLTPQNKQLSETSQKRLQALAESSGYGGGMKIALRDLEIRGAGDLLGVQQSGQISSIGFHLYCKLLKKAIEALQKKAPLSFSETKMEFSLEANLPESYINETSLRMEFYYRLGSATAVKEVEEILIEMRDRFGKPPKPVELLCLLFRLKIQASLLHIHAIKIDRLTLHLERQIGSHTIKESFAIPRSAALLKNLVEFEQAITKLLQEWNPIYTAQSTKKR
jgi:transcription-repair coupling factor (superfamily II helicase)